MSASRALAHDFGFSLWWVTASTLLIWVAPGQVILISALGGGAGAGRDRGRGRAEQRAPAADGGVAAAADKQKDTPPRRAACCRRISPPSACGSRRCGCCRRCRARRRIRVRERARHRLHACRPCSARSSATISSASLPPLLTAALLFLTPMSFLISTARNCRAAGGLAGARRSALMLGPLLAYAQVGLDLMWTGIIGGTAAYGIHRLREALR